MCAEDCGAFSEAKGGKAGLGRKRTSYGYEMDGQWISHSLREIIARNPMPPNQGTLAHAFQKKHKMLAGVVRLNIERRRVNLRIGVQIYDPPKGLGMVRWKGFGGGRRLR